MVFQHPAQSLNPRLRVEQTLAEPLRLLTDLSDPDRRRKRDEVLRLVGLGPEYAQRRPSQLSGGQQQRVAIARALICDPDLVVLDEPTSSLDQSVRARIVALLREIQRARDVAYLFISHDLSTVQRIAHRVAVMYLGRVVELARTETVFEAPRHPYTNALLSAVPQMGPQRRDRIILHGETPNPADLPIGCSFQDRCPLVHDRCRQDAPRLLPTTMGRLVECFAVTPEATHTSSRGRRLSRRRSSLPHCRSGDVIRVDVGPNLGDQISVEFDDAAECHGVRATGRCRSLARATRRPWRCRW